MFTVTENRCGWGYTVKQAEATVHKDSAAYRHQTVNSAAYRHKTVNLTMEVEAVTHALYWLATKEIIHNTKAVILANSMNLLQKVKARMIR